MALAAADLILPISRTAASDLMAWWREQGHDPDRLPPVRPVPLAAEMVGVPRVMAADPPARETTHLSAGARAPVRFLAVGTVEPRKNQLALMQAVNRLRRRRPELDIRLDVVGALHHAVAAAVQQEAARSGGCIRLHQYTPEAALRTMMRRMRRHGVRLSRRGLRSAHRGEPLAGQALPVFQHGIDGRDRSRRRLPGRRSARPGRHRRRPGAACRRRRAARSSSLVRPVAATDAVERLRTGDSGGARRDITRAAARRHRGLGRRWRGDRGGLGGGIRARVAAPLAGRFAGDSPRFPPGWRVRLPGIGRGELRGLWALLPLSTTHGPGRGDADPGRGARAGPEAGGRD